jgi:bifunctional DNA-binding transcriptional regulator/antitoxin component of YhaV-PrlF toxin-antitoxin module
LPIVGKDLGRLPGPFKDLTSVGENRIIRQSDVAIVRFTDIENDKVWAMTKELFRLRIASKRQITVPQRLMNVLGLSEGDELQVELKGNQISDVRPCKVVPTHLFSSEIVAALEAREREIQSGKGKRLKLSELEQQSEKQPAAVAR